MSLSVPDLHRCPPNMGDTKRARGGRSTVGQPKERADMTRPPRAPRVKMQPVEAMCAAARQQGIALAEVMRRAGVCEKSHWSWRHEYAPNSADLEAALNVVGLTLRAVPMEPRT